MFLWNFRNNTLILFWSLFSPFQLKCWGADKEKNPVKGQRRWFWRRGITCGKWGAMLGEGWSESAWHRCVHLETTARSSHCTVWASLKQNPDRVCFSINLSLLSITSWVLLALSHLILLWFINCYALYMRFRFTEELPLWSMLHTNQLLLERFIASFYAARSFVRQC